MATLPSLPLPPHAPTMERLEALRRTSPKGTDYWKAREVGPVLGYPTWREFHAVLERGMASCEGNGITPEKHFVLTHNKVELGSGAMRDDVIDYFMRHYRITSSAPCA